METDLYLEGSIEGMPAGWVPSGVDETPPELLPEVEALWEAWQALQWSRDVGFDISPLRLPDVVAYCDLLGIDHLDQRRRILLSALALDREFLKFHAEKMKKKDD